MRSPDAPCPDENTLLAMMDGQLDAQALAVVEAHLDQCASCAQLMIALGQLAPLAPTLEQPTPGPVAQVQAPPGRQRLGRYVLSRVLGMGGMGAVYEAFDPELRRRVAIKILRPDQALRRQDDSQHRARMRREARALAALTHPHVLTIFDAGEEDDGRLWFATALIQGQSVPQWIEQQRPSWLQIARVYLEAARGLEAAHAVGVLHRDVKPQNIMVDHQGRAVLVDFGLAMSQRPELLTSVKLELKDAALTSTGMIVGTPLYMAPEQLAGQRVDARADQFSWCVSLYEGLYGFRPFQSATLEGLLGLMQRGELVMPRSQQVPAALFEVLRRGLSPRAEERFEDMTALILEAQAALEGAQAAASPEQPLGQPLDQAADRALARDAQRAAPRVPAWGGAALALVALGALMGWGVAAWRAPAQATSSLMSDALSSAEPSPASAAAPAVAEDQGEPEAQAPSASRQTRERLAVVYALGQRGLEAALTQAQADAQRSPERPSQRPSERPAARAQASSRPSRRSAGEADGRASSDWRSAAVGSSQGASAPLNLGPSSSPEVRHGESFSDADRALGKALYLELRDRWVPACMSVSAFEGCKVAIRDMRRDVRSHQGPTRALIYLRDQGANPDSVKVTASLMSGFLHLASQRAGEAGECALGYELFEEFHLLHAQLHAKDRAAALKRARDGAVLRQIYVKEHPGCAAALP